MSGAVPIADCRVAGLADNVLVWTFAAPARSRSARE